MRGGSRRTQNAPCYTDAMVVREVQARSVLSKSQVYDWVVNPYTGCQHACAYCYARFMKRFTGHGEPWGEFVDVKVNAPDLLQREVARKRKGRVWVSGVCDPYQPLEARYRLTRRCLEILIADQWPVTVQTRSPLVTRDIDLFRAASDIEAGLSITTADEEVRRLFEPHAPSIGSRIAALGELHTAGISTFAMIAPMLPGAGELVELLAGRVDYLLLDRMNYNNANWVYAKYGLQRYQSDEFFEGVARQIAATCKELGIECR